MAALIVTPLEFQPLDSTVSIYTFSPRNSSINHTDPTTILICPWLGVHRKSRTLNSVYAKYQSLCPAARIISIRTLPQYFITTLTSTRLSTVHPVVSAIESDPAPEKRVLVHLFSNGGAVTFSDICRVYKESNIEVLPVKAIILDSAPCDPSLKEGWAAVSSSRAIPKGLLWYPAATVAMLMLGVMWIGKNIFGTMTLVERSRGWLKDESLFDGKSKRLYIYSETDRIVGWRDVERHAEEAGSKGWDVKMLKEVGSPHVQHIVQDKSNYWQSVKQLWRSAS